jgi:hypothetical protein
MLTSPFADDDSRRLLDRLRFLGEGAGERGETTLFSDKLKRYRELKEPSKPVVVLESPKPTGRKPFARAATRTCTTALLRRSKPA